MILQGLHDRVSASEAARESLQMIQAMFRECRSITGDGVRRTLDIVDRSLPLQRHELASGTPLFDWTVPSEWNIRDAHVSTMDGNRVIDFRASNLHVVNYSTPIQVRMTRAELEPHLHSLPDAPDWIPYRTTYYREDWGFCLRHRDREQLGDGPFDIVIDSTLAPGHLTLGECIVQGTGTDEAIIYTHTCHPSLANDNLTGIAVAAALGRVLQKDKPRLTWRLIFGPGTIGSLAWLSLNEQSLNRVRGGLVIGLLGDQGQITYKRSRRGNTATDRAAVHALKATAPSSRVVDFDPYGYDERQFCSPGFDLPVGRLTRSPNGQYPEYHSSGDNLGLIREESLTESIQSVAAIIAAIDANRTIRNLCPKGEPRLGKRGLYGSTGGVAPGLLQQAMLWVLSYSDGIHDLLAISERSGLALDVIESAALALEEAGLVAAAEAVASDRGDVQ